MSYDLHITRAERWIFSEETPITEQEWNQYLISDPEFIADEDESLNTSDTVTISFEGGVALWDYNGREAPFCYSKGRIYVSRAGNDINVVNKMKQIATALSAKVQGWMDVLES